MDIAECFRVPFGRVTAVTRYYTDTDQLKLILVVIVLGDIKAIKTAQRIIVKATSLASIHVDRRRHLTFRGLLPFLVIDHKCAYTLGSLVIFKLCFEGIKDILDVLCLLIMSQKKV